MSRRVAVLAVSCAVFASGAWMLLDLAAPSNSAGGQWTVQNEDRRPQARSRDPADPPMEAVATASQEQPGVSSRSPGRDNLAAPLVDRFMRGEQDTLPTALLIDQLGDPGLPLADRRKAAWRLAEVGSPDAMAALEAAMAAGSPDLRATIAEALGSFQHPQAPALLRELVEDDDPMVARGAVRGVAASANPHAIDVLGMILRDDRRPESVRAEAAMGLAGLADRESSERLLEAFDVVRSQDSDLWQVVLEGLGSHPFSEVGDFYRDLVDSSDDPELRTVAIETLSESTGEVAPFLLHMAESDSDPEVRAAAVWALGSLEGQAGIGKDLMTLLSKEEDQDVRRNLYGAIGSQASASFHQVLKSASDESDLDVRLQALGAAARLLSARSFASQRRQFDDEVVPELLDIALHDEQVDRQINAFNALVLAHTDGAQTAIGVVADADSSALGEAARQVRARHERQP